jgi:hypothetical protein
MLIEALGAYELPWGLWSCGTQGGEEHNTVAKVLFKELVACFRLGMEGWGASQEVIDLYPVEVIVQGKQMRRVTNELVAWGRLRGQLR